jgi:hypothetical protein
MVFKQKTGSRAQVMHGTAKMTGGGLKKKDLKYNKHGKIVSKKLSAIAKREKRLEKAGWTTIEGQFGAMQIRGAGRGRKKSAKAPSPAPGPTRGLPPGFTPGRSVQPEATAQAQGQGAMRGLPPGFTPGRSVQAEATAKAQAQGQGAMRGAPSPASASASASASARQQRKPSASASALASALTSAPAPAGATTGNELLHVIGEGEEGVGTMSRLKRRISNSDIARYLSPRLNTTKNKLHAVKKDISLIYELDLFNIGVNEISQAIIMICTVKNILQKVLLVDLANMIGEHLTKTGETFSEFLEGKVNIEIIIDRILDKYSKDYYIIFICNTVTAKKVENSNNYGGTSYLGKETRKRNVPYPTKLPWTYWYKNNYMFININTEYFKYALGEAKNTLKSKKVCNEFDDLFLNKIADMLITPEDEQFIIRKYWDEVFVLSNDSYSWLQNGVTSNKLDIALYQRLKEKGKYGPLYVVKTTYIWNEHTSKASGKITIEEVPRTFKRYNKPQTIS